jgi:hypothetical protein
MPSEPDHNCVEYGENNKKDGMCIGKAIELIDNKKEENNYGGRICPESFSQKPDNQEDFHDAVTQKIDRCKKTRLT